MSMALQYAGFLERAAAEENNNGKHIRADALRQAAQRLIDQDRENGGPQNEIERMSVELNERETGWAQAHRLALELECLLLDCKDMAIVSKWWDSGMEAIDEYHRVKPGAAEEAEAWAKMRKAGI